MTEEQLKTLESIKDRLFTVANDLHAKVDNRDLSSDQKSFLLGQMVATTFTLSYKLDSLYNDVSKTKHRINIPCHEQKNHTPEEHGELDGIENEYVDSELLSSILNEALEKFETIPRKQVNITTEDLIRWKNDSRSPVEKGKELLELKAVESISSTIKERVVSAIDEINDEPKRKFSDFLDLINNVEPDSVEFKEVIDNFAYEFSADENFVKENVTKDDLIFWYQSLLPRENKKINLSHCFNSKKTDSDNIITRGYSRYMTDLSAKK